MSCVEFRLSKERLCRAPQEVVWGSADVAACILKAWQ